MDYCLIKTGYSTLSKTFQLKFTVSDLCTALQRRKHATKYTVCSWVSTLSGPWASNWTEKCPWWSSLVTNKQWLQLFPDENTFSHVNNKQADAKTKKINKNQRQSSPGRLIFTIFCKLFWRQAPGHLIYFQHAAWFWHVTQGQATQHLFFPTGQWGHSDFQET